MLKPKIQFLHKKSRVDPATGGVVLRARLDDHVDLTPQTTYPIPSGVVIDPPDGYCVRIRPISKLCLRGIMAHDAAYLLAKGEVAAILSNTSRGTVTIKDGDEICIAHFEPIASYEAENVPFTAE